jgi:hypothetical protein
LNNLKLKRLNATTLRLILSVSLFLIAAAGVAGFTFAKGYLQTVAIDTSHSVVDASASQDNLQTLQKIQKILVADKDVIARTSSIVADSQSYQYQDQIIGDLNNYASKAGISITNLDFSAATTAATPSPTTSHPTPGSATPIQPTGVKSTSVAVTLNNPVGYDNLLTFIRSVEQNLTKMQISRVSLSKGTDSNSVSSDVLTIEVYIK